MRFIETMKLENGIILNMDLHKARSQETLLHHFGIERSLPFEQLVPEGMKLKEGIFKLRVLYSKEIEEFSIEPYIAREIKKLKIVEGGDIEYQYKYEDRTAIINLLNKKVDCDDILIIKNGFVTDTSYTNIVFEDGEKLYTPDTFLLNGIKRRQLLNAGIISEKAIRAEDIANFSGYYLINSMMERLTVQTIC